MSSPVRFACAASQTYRKAGIGPICFGNILSCCCKLLLSEIEFRTRDEKNIGYLELVFQVAFSHVIIAHIVDDFLRELFGVSGHVPVHKQVTSQDPEAVLEHRDYRSCKSILVRE